MENQKLIYGGVGFLLGLTFSGNYRGIVILSYLYFVVILAVRVFLSYALIGIRQKGKSFDIFPENLSMQYNIWYNKIIINRSLATKLTTDADQIEYNLRQIFSMFLNWDIFYHYRPLIIKFE